MRQQVDARRAWLESLAESVAGPEGRRDDGARHRAEPPAARPARCDRPARRRPAPPDADLKARALADGGVQAMLDVFPAEIREVEEIK